MEDSRVTQLVALFERALEAPQAQRAGFIDDEAFVWLDKAVDEGSLRPRIMLPMFEDLRRDPRFARVTRRVGL